MRNCEPYTEAVSYTHLDVYKRQPYSMLDKLYSAAACEQECLTVDGAGHALSSSVEPELYWNTVESFIDKYLEK